MSINIEDNFNRSVTVLRLDDDESGDGEQYAVHIENVACMIQPLDESFAEDLTGSFGKDFLMFAASQDIVEGDRIVEGSDESGSGAVTETVYQVVGAESYEFLGVTRHMELRIRKQNA